MTKILEVKNLVVEFSKGEKVLNNVSFEIERGSIVSLIGLNGTGKTTLLKTIVGMIEPSSGEIIKHTERIFYIPQRSDLNTSFPLTVKEFCELFGDGGYREYLEQTGVSSLLKRKIGNLSGGQYQRVLIAVALCRKPDLLLLDEVTAGLDVKGEEDFYELILELRRKYEISIIVVSHNVHMVLKNADKVLCLAGHICCTGRPSEMKEDKVFQSIFGKYLQPYIHKHDHVH